MSKSVKNFFLLLLLASFWGPSFLFIKVIVEYIPPVTTTAIRMGIGCLILYIILKFKKVKLPQLKLIWKDFAIAGLLQGGIPFTLFAISEKTIDSSIASIICGSIPLFTMVMAHYFVQNDRFTKAKLIGSSLGFFGLFMLVFPSIFFSDKDLHIDSFGIILAIMASMSYSMAFIYIKRNIVVSDYPPLTIPVIQLFISFLVLTSLAFIFENPVESLFSKNLPFPVISSILALSIFGTSLAFVVYYRLISLTSASYIAMVNYMVPVFGVVLGMAVLDEKLDWNAYLGCILILIGVMIASGLIRFTKQKMITDAL